MFDFPTYQQLVKEQLAIIMDKNKRKLIIGPPGYGKTVLALFISSELPQNEKVKYLVYNKTLNDYIGYAINANQQIQNVANNETWHSWFRKYYKRITGQNVPNYDDDAFTYDWSTIKINIAQKIGNVKPMKHLVIDEGQDMPKEFYDFVQFICESYYVFADQNQTISDHNSTIQDIRDNLGKELKEYPLTKNHRNTIQIAKIAKQYYVGLPSGIPELPEKRKGPKPVCYIKPNEQHLPFIKTYCRSNNKKSIGIFLPTNELVKEVCLELSNTSMKSRLDYYHGKKYYDCPSCFTGTLKEIKGPHGVFWGCSNYRRNDPNACTYKWTSRNYWPPKKVNFKSDSIIVLNYSSAKGLEFDTVILPYLGNDYFSQINDGNKMKFYVITSRARTELIFLKPDTTVNILDGILDIKELMDIK